MAGLLDGWGDFVRTPEGQGLLSAVFGGLAGARKGQPINSIGRAGLAGLSGYSGAEDRIAQMADSKVKRGYMQSQIDENASQNATRAQALKRQQEQDAYFMGTQGAGLLADAPTSPGAYKPSIDGMGPVAPMPTTGTAPSMGKFDEWSAQFGIPKDALIADYRANGGKGIADMLYKRGTPDMTVSNNYIFDKNRQGAGFLPSLSTSQSGQTSMTRIGADGLPVVSAPEGAVNTFGAYKSVESGLKPIKVYNPRTGREEYRTEAQVVGATAPSAASPRPMAPRQGDSDQKAIFGQELTAAQGRLAAAKTPEEKTRAQSDIDGLGREMSRLGLSASGNFAAGPSTAEATAAKVAETKAVEQTKADINPTDSKISKYESATDAVKVINKALAHPGLSAATGLQGSLDPRNFIPGTDAKNFRVILDQLKGTSFLSAFASLKGGGAITEVEGAKAEAAIARLNAAQSTEAFTDALNDYKEILNRGLQRAGATLEKDGIDKPTTPSGNPAPKVVDAMPTANASNRGQRIRDTATGKILVSNGIQWKPE